MELSIRVEGKKFMWDGEEYPNKEECEKKKEEYTSKGFEVKIIEKEGKYYIYTRKTIKKEEIKK